MKLISDIYTTDMLYKDEIFIAIYRREGRLQVRYLEWEGGIVRYFSIIPQDGGDFYRSDNPVYYKLSHEEVLKHVVTKFI